MNLRKFGKKKDVFHLDLQEVNMTPDVPDGEKLLSKGFSSHQTQALAEYDH
ncbi:hypothetical protein IWX76_000335 [Pedobacter sp. CAN_A7]|uniref:hypothetical protein n=1 Tax=Pedobacter sp. CAN_A7 TaxID=2787722 RepID=UPI0018CB0694